MVKDKHITIFINAYAFYDNKNYYLERPSLTSFFINLIDYYGKVTIYQYYKPHLDGHEVIVDSASHKNVDMKLIKLNRRGMLSVTNFFPIIKQIASFTKNITKYDELMCIGFSIFGSTIATLALFFKKPFIFYIRGDAHENNLFERKSGKRSWLLYKLIDFFNSYNLFLIKKAKVVSVCGKVLQKKYSGLNKNVFSVTPLLPDYYRLSATPDCSNRNNKFFTILYVGWMLKRKGIYDLLDAAQLLKKFQNVKLCMIGEGKESKSLKQYVDGLDLQDEVQIYDALSNQKLISFYDSADILILPSYTEGTPRVIAEAFSRKLPVIATRVGSIPLMIDNYKNGLLIEPGDRKALYKALVFCIQNPEKLNTMRDNAHQDAAKYMIKEQSERFIELLKQVDRYGSALDAL